ncbi:MAG: hypothetical protein DME32_18125, partial [Verrucomicrobia bacterium]
EQIREGGRQPRLVRHCMNETARDLGEVSSRGAQTTPVRLGPRDLTTFDDESEPREILRLRSG